MAERLSVAEIYERFESEWVLLDDPETDEALNVQRGTVLCHSKDRDEVYRELRELRPKHSAVLFTGRIPEDSAVIL